LTLYHVSIAIDVVDIIFSNLPPSVSSSVIAFLKNDLIGKFKIFYKVTHSNSTKESFVICSRVFYELLDNLEKEHYRKVSSGLDFYQGNLMHFRYHSELLDFIDKVGFPKRYDRIDDVYIEPMIFKEIMSILENNHVVFITVLIN
jgi:hypothetical protein